MKDTIMSVIIKGSGSMKQPLSIEVATKPETSLHFMVFPLYPSVVKEKHVNLKSNRKILN